MFIVNKNIPLKWYYVKFYQHPYYLVIYADSRSQK